jgi:hypothetical protein
MSAGNVRRSLAIVVLVAAFGGCSGSDDDAASNDVTSDDVGARGAGDDLANAYRDDSVVPGSAELEEALLTFDDLPDGMIEVDLHYSAVEICGMRTEMPDQFGGGEFPAGAAGFALDSEPIVPDVLEKIVSVPAGEGREVFARARRLLDMNCSNGEVDGLLFLSSTDLDVPTLGDESVAKRVTIQELASGTTIAIDLLYARLRDTIVAVGVVEPDGQTDRLAELATIAFDRATAA